MEKTKSLARLVYRNSGVHDDNDGLIIGALMTAGKSFFRKGYVYEIQEVLGEMVIKEMGPSWIKPTIMSGKMVEGAEGAYEARNQVCWSNAIGDVLTEEGLVFLTEDEIQND